ncbi:MAG: RagB/SusD family nutrient uptake outer membrane protein, partial [Sphingobacteriales bacterium]
MKKIFIILTGISLVFSTSCKKTLNKEPLNIISDNQVWSDPVLATAYLDQVLAEMTFMFANCDYDPTGANVVIHVWNIHDQFTRSDEGRHAYPWYPAYTTWGPGFLDKNGGFDENWMYPTVRSCNVFIKQMETSTLEEGTKKYLAARARWARAMCYFGMVERYGGVPLITTAQAINEPIEQLFVGRNKEEEVYDFIISEMDAIVSDLSLTEAPGYPGKGAAMALKSRAALYAASIATWGTVQLNGLVGIKSESANKFWSECYEASDALIKLGPHQLYNKTPDNPINNYRQMFVDPNNSESIYAVQFKGVESVGLNNGWDMFTGPQGFVAWAGNAAAPYFETVQWFQKADGSPFVLDDATLASKLWDPNELFAGLEPRFYANIYTQNTPWKGSFCDNHTSLILPDGSEINSGSYEGVAAQGIGNVDGGAITGFGCKKYLNEASPLLPNNWNTTTPWMVFRVGEIYLNQAQASMHLGKQGEALTLVNAIRKRAGVAEYGAIDEEKVRHERNVELMFE